MINDSQQMDQVGRGESATACRHSAFNAHKEKVRKEVLHIFQEGRTV